MPTYVYGCDACGHRFEKSQKFSDEPIRICPNCQSTVRRIFQPAGIVFKGSGWHVTDYKRSGSSGGDSADASETAASKPETAKADTKASDKPAETAASTTSEPATPAKATS
jgi:putative FmdB family regulatory protein